MTLLGNSNRGEDDDAIRWDGNSRRGDETVQRRTVGKMPPELPATCGLTQWS
jgi:hypothetical protein